MSQREDDIFNILDFSTRPLAIFEIKMDARMNDYSECAISARLRGENLKERTYKRKRPGTNYDEWSSRPITQEQKQEELQKNGMLL